MKKSHADNQDVVIAFGGDVTFFSTATNIHNPEKTALVGINSNPEIKDEYLCSTSISEDNF